MASITSYLSKPPSSAASFSTSTNKTNLVNNYSTHTQFLQPFITKHKHTPTKFNSTTKNRGRGGGGAPFVTTTSTRATAAPGTGTKKAASDERVQKIHCKEEFDEALKTAKDKLVVVEYAASHSENSKKIYPFLVELSKQCGDVEFLLVMGDESDKTRELCRRENVDKVPHFSFYKSMEKIHEEEAIGPDQLRGDVLYYGDSHSAVVQLHSGEDVKQLIEEHKTDDKLIVLDVGLKHCGPCVKVYPTVLKLSRQMTETVVFARMNGDENESCMNFLREMNVIEVPTFLFIRDGKVRGRYVGSGKGELIGEILRYQGVRVTY